MPKVKLILYLKGPDVTAVAPSVSVREAATKMADADVSSLIVQEGEKMLGIVTERDLVRRVLIEGRDPKDTQIGEVMSSPVKTCSPSDDAAACADLLAAEHIRHLAVVDDGNLAGVISLRDVQMAVQSYS